MPLIVIVTPGHPLAAKVRHNLQLAGAVYEIECQSRVGPCCPICASDTNQTKVSSIKYECWTCWRDFWVWPVTDDGMTRSSTDHPATRERAR